MLSSFHHFYQCYFGYAWSRVGVLPMNVEVAEGCGSKLTNFTVERLQFIMNLTDVLPEITGSSEGFLTCLTLVLFFCFLVYPPEVFPHDFFGAEQFATLHTGKLHRGVVAFCVFPQSCFVPKQFAANHAENLPAFLVNIFHVRI